MTQNHARKGGRFAVLAMAVMLACTAMLPSPAAHAQASTPAALPSLQSREQPSAEALDLGRELARLTEAKRQLAMLMPMLAFNVRQIVTAANPKAEKDFDEVLPFVVGKVLRRPTSFEDIVAKVYAHQFTADELKQLVAFYSSPVGRKLIEKQPELGQEVAKISQPLGQEISRELSDLMRKELRKRGHSL